MSETARTPAAGSWLPWAGVVCIALVAGLSGEQFVWLVKWPEAWSLPFAQWISQFSDTIAQFLRPVFRALSWLLEQPMVAIRDTLQWLPWPAVVLLALAVTLRSGASTGVVVITLLSLAYVLASGYWLETINTLALVAVAVPLSVMTGLAGGIAVHRSARARRAIMPLLDVMQTMPTFAYLIPILFLFGFGPVVGLIASAIFATPPMIRNVALGLERVAPEVIEAGQIAGASRWQQLAWVELPAAAAQLKIGLNQTIMAALSMVIIAAVIGGFDDIGWEVLSNMRKARFGDSLLSGVVIVLIAVVLDRVSAAFATGEGTVGNTGVRRVAVRACLGAGLLAIVVGRFAGIETPSDVGWIRDVSAALDSGLTQFVAAYGDVLTATKNLTFYYYLLPVRIGLSQAILPFTWGFVFTPEMKWGYAVACGAVAALIFWRYSWRGALACLATAYIAFFGLVGAPWLVISGALVALAFVMAGWRLAAFALGVCAMILTTGLWEKAMLSVYLCGSAALLAFVLGASLGVAGALNENFSRALRPVLDTFQTIPLFVFLIPVLMLFQIGEFTALLAIIAYAFVPAARYTESGLRQVRAEVVEVAEMQGCSRAQIFWQIKVPMAAPVILLGLNQTVLYAFAMLVIAALVGTTGLGQEIYLALSAANVGAGLLAGCAMAFLAMIADRLLNAWADRLR